MGREPQHPRLHAATAGQRHILPGVPPADAHGHESQPGLPRLRRELGPRAGDGDLLLAAFYDKALLEPLRKPRPEYRFRTSPLHELVAWMGQRRDIEHARIRFAGTEMTFSA